LDEARTRQEELIRVEMKQFSSHTLKRLLRVSDIRTPNLKPTKSVVVTPTSPLDEVITAVENDQLVNANKTESYDNKDTAVDDSNVTGSGAEESKGRGPMETKTGPKRAESEPEIKHKSSAVHLSVKVDSPTKVGVSEEAAPRQSSRLSRDLSAERTGASGISDTRDGEERTSEFRFEVASDVSGTESSNQLDAPRSVMYMFLSFQLLCL